MSSEPPIRMPPQRIRAEFAVVEDIRSSARIVPAPRAATPEVSLPPPRPVVPTSRQAMHPSLAKLTARVGSVKIGSRHVADVKPATGQQEPVRRSSATRAAIAGYDMAVRDASRHVPSIQASMERYAAASRGLGPDRHLATEGDRRTFAAAVAYDTQINAYRPHLRTGTDVQVAQAWASASQVAEGRGSTGHADLEAGKAMRAISERLARDPAYARSIQSIRNEGALHAEREARRRTPQLAPASTRGSHAGSERAGEAAWIAELSRQAEQKQAWARSPARFINEVKTELDGMRLDPMARRVVTNLGDGLHPQAVQQGAVRYAALTYAARSQDETAASALRMVKDGSRDGIGASRQYADRVLADMARSDPGMHAQLTGVGATRSVVRSEATGIALAIRDHVSRRTVRVPPATSMAQGEAPTAWTRVRQAATALGGWFSGSDRH